MAITLNTVQTYTRTNIMEDVANMINNVDPTATPFLSMLRVGSKPKGTYFEWLQDTHRDGDGNNAQVEGSDAVFRSKGPTTRLGNYTQISHEAVSVSDTSQAVQNYGYSKELTYQVMKSAIGLKKDMETRLIGNYGSSAGTQANYSSGSLADGTGSQTAGAVAWITTNVDAEASGANGGFNSATKLVAARTLTAQESDDRSLDEGMFLNLFSKVMENTDTIPKTVFVPIRLKARLSRTFKGVGTIQPSYPIGRGSAPSTLTAVSSIDFYQTDFGLVSLMWNRYMNTRTVLLLNMKKWEIKYLIPYRVLPIARTGESIKRLLTVQYGLCCKHEKSNGLFADIKNEDIVIPTS